MVSATSTDSDVETGNTATLDVTVNDVTPTVTFTGGATSVDEGATPHSYNYTISDPGTDTQTVATSCGTLGTISNEHNTDTGGSFDCTFRDGAVPALTSTVTVQATDSDGKSGNTAMRDVTVNDVAPTVTFTGGATSVDEGPAQHTYSYTISDPGTDTQTVATGCGVFGNISNQTHTDTGGSFDCTFPDGAVVPASMSAVTVQATDSDELAGNTDTRTVTVNNVTPLVSGLTLGANTGTACLAGKTVTLGFSFGDPRAGSAWRVDIKARTRAAYVPARYAVSSTRSCAARAAQPSS